MGLSQFTYRLLSIFKSIAICTISLFFLCALISHKKSYADETKSNHYLENRFKSESYSILYGDIVVEEYHEYMKRLKAYYLKLKKSVKVKAPALLAKLDKKPPEVIPPGYQRFPKIIIKDVNYNDPEKRTLESLFSWPSLSSWVNRDTATLMEQEEKLKAANAKVLEKLVDEYAKLNAHQKTMNSQVQYNRFWQKDVVLRETFYNENTKIYDGLLNGQLNPDEETKKRVKGLFSEIPKFITLEEKSPDKIIVNVKMVTDILDKTFLKGFRTAVEKYWQVSGPIEYSLKLDLQAVNVKDLYAEGKAPKKFDPIDVNEHVAHFGVERGIVTTGAGVTYYSHHKGRRYFVLGVGDVGESVLAHEFGHILTFNDAYFRGARELGDKGFAVLEIVPDVTDIMAAPGLGRVKPYHFEILVSAIRNRDQVQIRGTATAEPNTEK